MKTIVIPLLLVFAGTAIAAETAAPRGTVHSITLPKVTVELRPGPGRERAQGYCSVCHSVDYIVMQPPFTKAKWGEIVAKMVKAFGAPIPKDAQEEIVGY